MDTYRITQILQELVNDENNRLTHLNNLLQEAINSQSNYDASAYQNLDNLFRQKNQTTQTGC